MFHKTMTMTREYEYKDDYATRVETYATLRIFPGELSAEDVTARLGH
jgi:hypothetical protein